MATANRLERYQESEEVELPAIQYWIVTAVDKDGYSPYQGFGFDVCRLDFASLIEYFSVLPATVDEVFAPAGDLWKFRGATISKSASIVGLPSFRSIQESRQYQETIQVVLALPGAMEEVRRCVTGREVLFVSTKALTGCIAVDDFRGHPAQLLDDELYQAAKRISLGTTRSWLSSQEIRAPFATDGPRSRIAGVTHANESLAASLGFSYEGAERIDARDDDAYVSAILESLEQARGKIEKESTKRSASSD